MQEAIQALNGCEVADEPVVVMKSRPMKPGNSVEEKTGTMTSGGLVGKRWSKAIDLMRRGEVNPKRNNKGKFFFTVHKLFDGTASSLCEVNWEQWTLLRNGTRE